MDILHCNVCLMYLAIVTVAVAVSVVGIVAVVAVVVSAVAVPIAAIVGIAEELLRPVPVSVPMPNRASMSMSMIPPFNERKCVVTITHIWKDCVVACMWIEIEIETIESMSRLPFVAEKVRREERRHFSELATHNDTITPNTRASGHFKDHHRQQRVEDILYGSTVKGIGIM